MMLTAFRRSVSEMTKGGANRMMLTWVGLASYQSTHKRWSSQSR